MILNKTKNYKILNPLQFYYQINLKSNYMNYIKGTKIKCKLVLILIFADIFGFKIPKFNVVNIIVKYAWIHFGSRENLQ